MVSADVCTAGWSCTDCSSIWQTPGIVQSGPSSWSAGKWTFQPPGSCAASPPRVSPLCLYASRTCTGTQRPFCQRRHPEQGLPTCSCTWHLCHRNCEPSLQPLHQRFLNSCTQSTLFLRHHDTNTNMCTFTHLVISTVCLKFFPSLLLKQGLL